jgi:hypothetical protein
MSGSAVDRSNWPIPRRGLSLALAMAAANNVMDVTVVFLAGMVQRGMKPGMQHRIGM